jgi:hypothetical protein
MKKLSEFLGRVRVYDHPAGLIGTRRIQHTPSAYVLQDFSTTQKDMNVLKTTTGTQETQEINAENRTKVVPLHSSG